MEMAPFIITNTDDRLRSLLIYHHTLLLLAANKLIKKNGQKKRKKRRWWVRPVFPRCQELGEFRTLIQELQRQNPEYFFTMFRMTPSLFSKLVNLMGKSLSKYHWSRKPVSAEERLAVTLRYLATGDQQQTIAVSYHLGRSTVSNIIAETCHALVDVLTPLYMREPSKEDWQTIADDFFKQWQFPNCLGNIDGKHIKIPIPKNSGSQWSNYKGFISCILMAVIDANCKFIIVDVGGYGRPSDALIFKESDIGKKICSNSLQVPEPSVLRGTNIISPYLFVADETFPLKPNLMRPFPGKNLSKDKKIFNCRLSRARSTAENAFGVTATRWRILLQPINVVPERVHNILLSVCLLHNFLRTEEEKIPSNERTYCPPGYIDYEDPTGTMINGTWRTETHHTLSAIQKTGSNMYSHEAAAVRNNLKDYFNSIGKIHWQNNCI